MTYNHIYLIHEADTPETFVQHTLRLIREVLGKSVVPRVFDPDWRALQARDLVFTVLEDVHFGQQWWAFRELDVCLLPLPCDQNPLTCKVFGLPTSLHRAIERANVENLETWQYILRANEVSVLERIEIGQWPRLPRFWGWRRIKAWFAFWHQLRMQAFRIQTAKGQTIELAALFIELAEERLLGQKYPAFFPKNQSQGRARALIYAPKSLFSLFVLYWRRWHPAMRAGLPKGIGSIESQALQIEAQNTLVCNCDGQVLPIEKLQLTIHKTRCRVLGGQEAVLALPPQDKDSVRVQALPTTPNEVAFYLKRPLPLFPVADELAFADLFTQLRKNARFSGIFAALMILASLLATLGLLQDSAPVIIGAMILAPLMAPIVSLAMGVLRFERTLVYDGCKTLLLGMGMALGLAALLAWILPLTHFTDEIRARLNPNLLDLGIAVISGIAAAYAYSKEEISKSLAGVAIAVALVPPLNVAGIGIGWGQWAAFKGALLLFLTNLVGIVAAAGFTFYVLGFASLRRARWGFAYKLVLLLLISMPLWYSTQNLLNADTVYRRFARLAPSPSWPQGLSLRLKEVRQAPVRPIARIEIRMPVGVEVDLRAMAEQLQKALQADIELERISYYPATVSNANR